MDAAMPIAWRDAVGVQPVGSAAAAAAEPIAPQIEVAWKPRSKKTLLFSSSS